MKIDDRSSFVEKEHDILKYWEEHDIFKKLVKKNKGNKPFRFLDGPITANNPMGIHHAWGRSIKDIFLRYKAMKGYSCQYRNGFDAQGLWVEVEVEKELGFKEKKDVEKYGMANFTCKCIERINKFSSIQTTQSKRLGQWMDWENSYYTHTDENITSIWYFLKKCHNNGWIKEDHRPMPWCPRCGTSLSEHEMTGSHKDITHISVFAKVPVKDRDFDVLVWTTTPWTLSANVALAVNPELDYAVVEIENAKRPLVLAKAALKYMNEDRKVVDIIKGTELVGLEYETFFPLLPVQRDLNHVIIEWSDVSSDEGSGIVHIAPGCGAEDYELGKKNNLAEICPINDNGVFTDEYDFLKGKEASKVAELVFEKLDEQDKLYKTLEYTHSYPVCWRCKTEVLFRLVKEWYIKTDEIRPDMIKASNSVIWEPAYIGKRMNDWLNNMGDWNISRKRFYGLPLPFYKCDNCKHLTVASSKEELSKLSGVPLEDIPELHRPWIDEVSIICPECGVRVSRVPEVGDVWLDAGITPFSTLGFFTDKNKWKQYFPVEWVIEMREQVRLWFYSMLFMSVTITGKAPYEKVYAHSSVVAEDGTKFSKTGFMIKFDEAAERVSSDAIRYLFAGASLSSDVRFGYNLGDEVRRKLLRFWNVYTFFMTYAKIDNPKIGQCKLNDNLDSWLFNRINDFVQKALICYENYNTVDLIREFEVCIDDVSNWYIRLNRKRFWKENLDEDKKNAYNILFYAIKIICQVMAPVIPFMTEYIWQDMIRSFDSSTESVHLSDFPKTKEISTKILDEVNVVREIVSRGLKLRNENQLRVKQPLSELYIETKYKDVSSKYLNVLKEELNVKRVIFIDDFNSLADEYLMLNFKVAGRILKSDLGKVKKLLDNLSINEVESIVACYSAGDDICLSDYKLPIELFRLKIKDKANIARISSNINVAINTQLTEALIVEGIYRSILRQCQILRKDAGFDVSDRVKLWLTSDDEYLMSIINKHKSLIEKETLSKIIKINDCIMKRQVDIDNIELTIRIC